MVDMNPVVPPPQPSAGAAADETPESNTTTWAYEAAFDNVKTMTRTKDTEQVDFTYDSQNRIDTMVWNDAGATYTFTYNADGLLTTIATAV